MQRAHAARVGPANSRGHGLPGESQDRAPRPCRSQHTRQGALSHQDHRLRPGAHHRVRRARLPRHQQLAGAHQVARHRVDHAPPLHAQVGRVVVRRVLVGDIHVLRQALCGDRRRGRARAAHCQGRATRSAADGRHRHLPRAHQVLDGECGRAAHLQGARRRVRSHERVR